MNFVINVQYTSFETTIITWNVWKEVNRRVFRDQSQLVEEIIKKNVEGIFELVNIDGKAKMGSYFSW